MAAKKEAVSAKTAASDTVEAQPDDLHDEAGLPESGVVKSGVTAEDSAVVRMAANEHAGAVQDAASADEARALAQEGADHREQWTGVQLDNAVKAAVEAANPVPAMVSEQDALAKQEAEVQARLDAVEKADEKDEDA